MKIVGVGDNTVDQYINLGYMYPGGNAVNVAVHMHRHVCDASYIGWFGDDHRGHLLRSALKEEGVDTSHSRVIPEPNAWTKIGMEDNDRVFLGGHSGARAKLYLEPRDFEFIAQHDVAHSSIYSYVEPQLAELRKASRYLTFDFSQKWDDTYLTCVVPFVDAAFLSFPEASDVEVQELAVRCHKLGAGLVVVTQGARGSLAYNGKSFFLQGVVDTEVVDTLGAGDAFIARTLVGYLRGEALPTTLARAAGYAATVCTYYGTFGRALPIF